MISPSRAETAESKAPRRMFVLHDVAQALAFLRGYAESKPGAWRYMRTAADGGLQVACRYLPADEDGAPAEHQLVVSREMRDPLPRDLERIRAALPQDLEAAPPEGPKRHQVLFRLRGRAAAVGRLG